MHSPSQNSVSFIRWAGSKRAAIPRLLSAVPNFSGRYFEPFMGSAALFFAYQPQQAVLSDINVELINAFRQVRKNPAQVHSRVVRLRRTPESYYRWRSKQPEALALQDRAVRFLFLNRLCFNGLYRTNSDGQFNVPFSGQRVGRFPSRATMHDVARQLTRASILVGDFESVIADVGPGDFVYMDPPYRHSNRRSFEYDRQAFDADDLHRLSKCLGSIDQSGARFLLTYADGTLARRHLQGWHISRMIVQRNIAGFAKHRRRAREVLVSNYEPNQAAL